MIHDAARPFPSLELISRVVEGAHQYGACVPISSVDDTVKEVHQDQVVRTIERKNIALAQTPQGFKMAILQSALESAMKENFYGTDESILVERLGIPVHIVPGERTNVKITWKEDV